MRAGVLERPGRFGLVEVARPEPGAGQVLVRLEGCGVCASNIEPWQGLPWMEYPRPPGDLGHEGWGVVEAVGREVRGVAVGARVASLGVAAYAEYDVVDAGEVVALPAGLDGRAFPGEPLGCAFNIFRRAAIEPGQDVAIIGIGFLGAVLTRLASAAGARVIAISRRDCSLELAARYGAAVCIRMEDHTRIIEQVREATGGALCARVIEAVGKQWPLDLAGEIVGVGGRLVIAGYHQDGPRQVNMQDWNWKGIDVVNAHERALAVRLAGVREAVAAVADGSLDTAPLFTHQFGLEALDAALAATRDKPDGFVKALVRLG